MTATATRRIENDDYTDGFTMQTVPQTGSGMVDVASTRAAQEVQAAMVIAKRFPRDENQAFNKIMTACKRRSLAEVAMYAYPRGNQTVTGPSIRMAEAMAQAWGNIDFGIIELEQKDGESSVMAYAWDLETNSRQTKIFTVKHERRKGRGERFKIDRLTDPRDIYEMTANQGARRLRACILGIIPGDVIDAALGQCEKTLQGGNGEPLADRVRRMASAFNEIGVTTDMVEKRLGHKLAATTEVELVNLRKVYQALKDNMASVSDFFDHITPNSSSEPSPGLDELRKQMEDGDQKPKQARENREAKAAKAAENPEVDPDASIEQAADDAASNPPSDAEALCILYEEMHGIPGTEAAQAMEAQAQKRFGKPLVELSAKQIADIRELVDKGVIAPR